MEGTVMGDETQLEQMSEPVCVTKRLEGVVIAALVGFADNGAPLVDFPGNPQDNPLSTRTTAFLGTEDVGREVALIFERADPSKPLLIGLIIHPAQRAMQKVSVQRDRERVELTAEREIVLRCGSASLTLTRAGKVLIRGAYVSTHSSGVNRIKGGSVQIN